MIEQSKIYINSLTVNSIKVLLLCNALGIKPEYEHIALNKGEHKQRDFLAVNPYGKVPVLQQGELLLTESNAILQYLAAEHKSKLWPQTRSDQAKVLSRLFWQSHDFATAVAPIAHRKVVMPFWGDAEQKIDEQHWLAFYKRMTDLELSLSKSEYIAGDQLTIADISFVAFFIFRQQSDMPLNDYPKLGLWLANLANQGWYKTTENELKQILSSQI